MKNKIIQFSIFIGLLFSIQAGATPIKSIELSGLSTIPNSTVLSYLSSKAGDEITDSTSNQIIKTLFATGRGKNRKRGDFI
jgi:outer membrane protein assembly factor BamA